MWAVALVLAPFGASRSHAATPWYALALATYTVGSVICHQLPERSFHLWAARMPVCARCTGIYFGAAATAIVTAFRTTKVVRRYCAAVMQGFGDSGVAEGVSPAKIALIIAVMPSITTLAYEWTTGQTPSNWIRAAAGAPIGGVVALIVGVAPVAMSARKRASDACEASASGGGTPRESK